MTTNVLEAQRQAAIQYAFSLLHAPYIWGGDSPFKGWDCSGLVQEILAGVGLDPKEDQTAQGLFMAFKSKSKFSPEPGCLVFFGQDLTKITHIGFTVAPGIMIEAGGGGSKTVSREIAISQNARVRMRAVSNRKDLVAVCDPFGGVGP